ncbi:MAG: amino acid adenylation domain-containing protein [Planctomycetaceae bacterium]
MFSSVEENSNLTRSQLLIWTGQQLSPNAPLYNMVFSFELNFALCVPTFERAFATAVAASDAMNTVVTTDSFGVPQAGIAASVGSLEVLSLQSDYSNWAAARASRMLNLGVRLWDSALVRLGQANYRWFLNKHHLITDASSVAGFFMQVSRCYSELHAGNTPQITSPKYCEYAAMEVASRGPVKDHWQQRSTNLQSPVLCRRVSQSVSSRTERTTHLVAEKLASRIMSAVSTSPFRGLTAEFSRFNLFATTLVAWQHRATGQHTVTLGTPAPNRATVAAKATVGLMIEMLPLQIEVSSDDSFATLAAKVQRESILFFKNATPGCSTAELARAFNVVLNYVSIQFGTFAGHDTAVEWLHPGHGDPSHHLRVQIQNFDGNGLRFHFDMNADHYDSNTRKKTAESFMALLNAVLDDPDQSVASAGLCSSASLVAGSHKNVLTMVGDVAEASPEATCISSGPDQWSYGALSDRSTALAIALQAAGVRTTQRVVILLPRSPDLVASILATWKCGAAFTPVDISFPAARVHFILEDLQPLVVLATASTSHLVPESQTMILAEDVDLSRDAMTLVLPKLSRDLPAYILYTSGSTGQPKGVTVSHGAIANYVSWASLYYSLPEPLATPFFTSPAFDLTLTAILVPLASGGQVIVYPESTAPVDLTVLDVIRSGKINTVKLTPSHLRLIRDLRIEESAIRQLIVGGENLSTQLANTVAGNFPSGITIHNEYGPTEATIGCMVHTFDAQSDQDTSVPVGVPIRGMRAYALDSELNPVTRGEVGELYLAGSGLADGYWLRNSLTANRFVPDPFVTGQRMYRSGDLVRQANNGTYTYLGRTDNQLKIRGVRIEAAEIEAAATSHPGVAECAVGINGCRNDRAEIRHCTTCGLPSSYPGVEFHDGLCGQCQRFTSWQAKTTTWFRTMDDLANVFSQTDSDAKTYDCIALLSGGKDSTFAVCQLVDLGVKVLTFTLDNGYLSDEAKRNIDRVVAKLGVDHIYASTPAMNAIFVDSLQRHANVCQGCFKTIYTLSMSEANKRQIPYIVTGLSRGQLFETRLTEDLFDRSESHLHISGQAVLGASRAYHRVDDAVLRNLDTDVFRDDAIFDKVKFIDFFRYCDVSLQEMLAYLSQRVDWTRPSDTGRSTNCLINDVGIYIHKKERGFHNYALPYSWDVRMGHKTREEALQELDDEIDTARVAAILDEIGYVDPCTDIDSSEGLCAWYVAADGLSETEVREHVATQIPPQMMPSRFIRISSLPLTANGKLDRARLAATMEQPEPSSSIKVEREMSEIEEVVAMLWCDELGLQTMGLFDNFFEVGGDSLMAMSVVTRMTEALEIDLPISGLFGAPTIAEISELVEELILADHEDTIGDSAP